MEPACVHSIATPTQLGEPSLDTATTIKRRIIDKLEKCKCSKGYPPILSYLNWDVVSLRESIVDFVVEGFGRHLQQGGRYDFESHQKELKEFLDVLALSAGTKFCSKNSVRFLKGFITACANLACKILHPSMANGSCISMDAFRKNYCQEEDFTGMTDSEWKNAHNFRNCLALSTTLVASKNNKLMHLESIALLSGINKCFQGSKPGRSIRRYQLLLNEFTDPSPTRTRRVREKSTRPVTSPPTSSPPLPSTAGQEDNCIHSCTENSIKSLIEHLERIKDRPEFSSGDLRLVVRIERPKAKQSTKKTTSFPAVQDSAHSTPRKRHPKRSSLAAIPEFSSEPAEKKARTSKPVKPLEEEEEEEVNREEDNVDLFTFLHANYHDDALASMVLEEDQGRGDHADAHTDVFTDDETTNSAHQPSTPYKEDDMDDSYGGWTSLLDEDEDEDTVSAENEEYEFEARPYEENGTLHSFAEVWLSST